MTLLSETAIFEICETLEFYGFFSIAQEIKEHDAAQREALARVEAQRNEVCDGLDRQTARLITAHQQLAEAVNLLRKARYLTGYDLVIDDFLAGIPVSK